MKFVKSAALVLDDMDLAEAAKTLARAECSLTGQVCSSLTRIVVTRGRHDELLRSFHSGHGFRFDILMDIGGFRDMHRHRRCVQLIQEFTDIHGYDEPICPGQPTLAEASLDTAGARVSSAYAAYNKLAVSPDPEARQSAQYLLPLGTRCRAMFKMDFAEALYISELRSGIAGHFSYRLVAWKMYQAIATRHPALARLFRIEDVNNPVDLLKR